MLELHKNSQLGYSVNVIPKEKSKRLSENRKPILYSSSGDFPTYDNEMYELMTNDVQRNELYKSEIKGQVEGKVVLDIGTGAHANWALYAAQCGAERVYAIESLLESYHLAKQKISDSQFESKITLLQGLSTNVNLPEKVDICISEILGCPASSEAVLAVLNDAKKRLLKHNARFIIDRCVTKVAACVLGDEFKNNLGICETDLKYLDRAFSVNGEPFDIRVLVDNFPRQWIVSSDAIMEDIEFNKNLYLSSSSSLSISIHKDSKIDGFVCWIELYGENNNRVLDTLQKKTNWLPAFFPVFFPGQHVKQGDLLKLNIDACLGSGKLNPDYHFKGEIIRKGELITEFEFTSAYISKQFRGSLFYRELFSQ